MTNDYIYFNWEQHDNIFILVMQKQLNMKTTEVSMLNN